MSDFGLGEVVKEVSGGTRGALRLAFGPALTEFGEMLADRMKYWRFKNLLGIRKKIDQILENRGLPDASFAVIPFGDSMRTIEAASQEDEDDVQELWAQLIIKAAESESPKINKLHIEILRSLTPADTALLELLHPNIVDREFSSEEEVQSFNGEMNTRADAKWRKFNQTDREVSVQNLFRLRCITWRPRPINADYLWNEMHLRESGIRGAFIDPQRFHEIFHELVTLIHQVSGAIAYDETQPIPLATKYGFHFSAGLELRVPELNFVLTPLGEGFMSAVTLDISQNLAKDML